MKKSEFKLLIKEQILDQQWPEEVLSLNGDIIFRKVKVNGPRAKYDLIDKETGKVHEFGGRIYSTVQGLKDDAADYVMALGGRQSSNFG